MRSWIAYFAAVFFLCTATSLQGQDEYRVTREAVHYVLQQKPVQHPSLILTDEMLTRIRGGIESNPTQKDFYLRILREAEGVLNQPVIDRKLEGIRLLEVSRQCLRRMIVLGMAYRFTGEEKYLRRAETEMLSAASFSDWNPSHFLDTAEMTAGLAIGYDWLYSSLSLESRNRIREAIVEKGLKKSINPSESWNGWLTCENNWLQVCHGGLALGAMAVRGEEPELSETIIHRAVHGVGAFMRSYDPDGVYIEGPMYWWYGTMYNVLLMSALQTSLGTDFGLSSSEGFQKTADYYLHMTGPTGQSFNYFDCHSTPMMTAAMFWFARFYHKDYLNWNEVDNIEQGLSGRRGGLTSDTVWPLALAWWTGTKVAPKEMSLLGRGRNPVAVFRTSWTDRGADYLAIKGGSARESHSHLDAGSFVYDTDGVRWAADLGMEDYHRLEEAGVKLWAQEQESDRWKIFRYSNFSHNTLTINGQLQQVNGFAPIIRYSPGPEFAHAVIDLSSIYMGQLSEVTRGVKMLRGGGVHIQDEIKTGDQDATVRWSMVTPAEVRIESDRAATLHQGDKTVRFVLLGDIKTRIATYSAEPRAAYDSPNPNIVIIGFDVAMQAHENAVIAVQIISSHSPNAESQIELQPVKEWSKPLPDSAK